jgi:hypothetical protein
MTDIIRLLSELNSLMDCRKLLDKYLKLVDIVDIVNITDGQSVTSKGFKIHVEKDYDLLIESLLKLWLMYSNVFGQYYNYDPNKIEIFGKKLTSPLYYAVLFLDETATHDEIIERSIIGLEYEKIRSPRLRNIRMQEELNEEQQSKIDESIKLTYEAMNVLSTPDTKKQYDEKTGLVLSDVTEQTEQTEQFAKLKLFRKLAIFDANDPTVAMEDVGIANLISAALKQSIKIDTRTSYKNAPYSEMMHTFMTSFLKGYYKEKSKLLPLDKIITYDSERHVIHIRTGVTKGWGVLGGDRKRYCDSIKDICKAMDNRGIYYTKSDSVNELCTIPIKVDAHDIVGAPDINDSGLGGGNGKSTRRRKAYKTTRRNNKYKNKNRYRRKRHTKRNKKSHRRRSRR